ncbi:MAG TPA: hypothetical protein VFB12_14025 [Ktedonobacteraceae bacterium]|nr:hypothetical protein [Ktedonobacteraceae bacterium]
MKHRLSIVPMAASTWVESLRCLPRSVPPASLSTSLQQDAQDLLFLLTFQQALTTL